MDIEVIKRYDRELKEVADLTVFVNSTLYEDEKSQCRKAIYVDHGVDFDTFASAELCDRVPDDMKSIRRPIVGFYGGIDNHTSDISLMEKVVDLLPDYSFVFVGKVSFDVSRLQSKENVCMLGQKPYEDIPHYGKCFDVCIMPWRQNRWIEACNPVKLKEYLALGKPIVSTPYPELQNYVDVVYEANTPEEFAEYIKKALFDDTPELIAKRRQKVAQVSWDSKAELVLAELLGNGDFERLS